MLDKIIEKYKKDPELYSRKANYALAFGIITLIFAPTLFSQLDWGFNFMKTGQIGDTIGGITTPILTLVGSFLVYYSFREQMIANKIQLKTLEEEKAQRKKELIKQDDDRIIAFCEKLSDEIQEEIKGFSFFHVSGGTITGEEGIKSLFNKILVDRLLPSHAISPNKHMSNLERILQNYELLLKYVNTIEDISFRNMFAKRYYNKISKKLSDSSTFRSLYANINGKNKDSLSEFERLIVSVSNIRAKMFQELGISQ